MANPIQRLIQYVLRGKDEMSPAANQSTEALEALRSKTAELSQTLENAKGARGLITGLENTRRAVGITETSLQRAETTVQALRESLDKNPDSKGLETSLKVAERDASTLRRTLDSLNAKLADQEKAAKDAGVDTSKLADEEKRLAAEVSKTKGELDQNTKSVRDLEREQSRAARTAAEHASRTSAVGEAMSRGVSKVLGFTAAYLGLEAALGLITRGLRAVASGIGSMLNTGDMFEGLQTRLTSLMGSVASGEQATEWITKFAKDTPLQLGDVTDAFALLKAYGLDPMDGTLKSLEDQSEKLGGGMERLEGIATAVGQAWAKQKLQTEEILQLVERGVPAWDLLAKVTGRSAGELQDLASAGRLGRDAIKALIEEMGRSSAGAAEANMRRLSGLISNLQDTATNFLNRIAKAGALEHVKQRLEALADTIDQMDKDGRLDALAESLSNAFVKGADQVELFAKKLLDVDFNKLVDDTTTWFNSFEEKINFVSTWATRLTAPFRLASNLVTGVMKTGLGAFSAFVGASLALIGGVARAIPDAFGGKKIVEGLEAARDTAFRITAEMGTGIAQDARDIRDTWNSVTGQVEQSVDAQVKAVERGAKAAKQASVGMTADVLDHFISTITGIENAMAAVKFADTSKQLDTLKVAITEAFQAGRLSLDEYQQALNAATTRQQSLSAATQQAAGASDEQARAVEQLKQQQAELLQQYLKHEITLEQYQNQHNALAQQLRDTGKASEEARG
ncbi:tape measure protein [Pseudomonas nitroreducens]|uniref:tape measure protein n=1 Tax=Pseudomonas nitroreducens TaxID=46680 RepID=UPI002D8001A3|nr:tape measure protein [Pseudomonas nitroreducens]